MEGQLGLELFELALVTDEAKFRRREERAKQRMGRELGDAIGQADRKANGLVTRGVANLAGQRLADAKYLLGRANAISPASVRAKPRLCGLSSW